MAAKRSKPAPDFRFERVLLKNIPASQAILALDEVGRGCLAGPVVTGASLWVPLEAAPEADLNGIQKLWIPMIRDSKKMTERAREILFDASAQSFPFLRGLDIRAEITRAQGVDLTFSALKRPAQPPIAFDTKGKLAEKKGTDKENATALPATTLSNPFVCVGVALGAATPSEIDEVNIWNAVQLAMGRAMTRLAAEVPQWLKPAQTLIVVDGNKGIVVPAPLTAARQVTAVGGDAAFASVGLSSVVAKVVRDRYMVLLNDDFPGYGFDRHKGYATEEHRTEIEARGPNATHRKSFLGFLQSE
jgi:ribonuclease HII